MDPKMKLKIGAGEFTENSQICGKRRHKARYFGEEKKKGKRPEGWKSLETGFNYEVGVDRLDGDIPFETGLVSLEQ
jgi:hypothetical protein